MKIPRANGIVTNRVSSTGQVETAQTQSAVSGASSVMGFVQKYKAEQDRTKVLEAVNAATKRTNDWKIQNLARTGKDADGITEDFLKFNEELESELGQNLSNNARSEFADWNIRASESDRMNVMLHQKKQDEYVKQTAFNDGINIVQETVRTDAKNWPKAYDHLESTLQLGLQSGVIKEEEFETKRTEITNKMRTELGKSYYTQDKHDFMREINKFGFGEPEVAYYKDKYQKDLAADAREQKALFSEEAKLLYGKRDDMKAQALANADTSHFFEGAQKLRKMGYSEWAGQLEEDGNLYKKVVDFSEQNRNKPLKEIVQAAQGLNVGSELEGSDSEYKSRQAIQLEVQKQAKIFNSDPAQYVRQWAQGGTMEEIADSRLSLQQTQGLYPVKGFHVLTKEEKNTFKGAWESADIRQKTDLIVDSFRYGKHTPRVLDEVGVNSALSLAPVIGFDEATGINKKNLELLVAGVSTKPDLLDDAQKSEYASAAKGSDFYNTLLEVQKKFPTNPDLPQRIKDIEGAMTGIGARMVNPEAGAKFFDERIETVNTSDKIIYFPNSIDSDEVEDALDKRKDEIVSKFKTGDMKKDNLSKWAIRDAVWVNTASGFVLADSRSGAYLEGSQIDMLDLEPLKKDLARQKMKEGENSVSMRR